MEFSISTIIFIVIVAYAAIVGVASLVTGKVYGMGNSAKKYTEESLHAFSRPWGITEIIVAIGIACFEFLNDPLFNIGDFGVPAGWVALAVCAVVAIVIGVFAGKMLKEK